MEDASIQPTFSDLTITRACSGMGTSGICTSSLTFSVPREDYEIIISKKAPKVIVTIYNELENRIPVPEFFVDSRPCVNGRVNFTCYDKMAFADGIRFTETDIANLSGKITALALYQMIAAKMQLTISGGLDVQCIKDIDVEALPGTTCAEWLEKLSAVQCGFFYITNDNKLAFSRYNHENGSLAGITEYTEPDFGNTLTVSEIIVDGDSGKQYTRTDNNNPGGLTLNISGGALVNNRTTGALANIVLGTTYTYGKVEKAIVYDIPQINSMFRHSGSALLINNITAVISRTGITASLAANQAGGNEIGQLMGRISRQLDAAIKSGDKLNNGSMLATRYQGIIWRDDNDEEE